MLFLLRSRSLGVLVSTLALALCSITPALAANIQVTTTEDELNVDGDCSLREAISSANQDVPFDACIGGLGPDTIFLVAGALYLIDEPGIGEDNNVTGDLDIRSSMTIRSVGPAGPAVVRMNMPVGSQFTRVLHVRCNDATLTDIDVTLENFDVQLGFAHNGEPGGGLFIEDCVGATTGESNVTIDGMEFLVNAGNGSGGAIGDATGGFVTIRNSSFIGNRSDWSLQAPTPVGGGGAILVSGGGLTTIEDCLFTDNHLRNSTNQHGAAVLIESPTNLRRSSFWNNDARQGAVVSCQDTAMNLDNVTISDNLGIGAQSGSNNALAACTLSISSSTIADNSVSGLRNQNGVITLNNNVVAQNGPGPSVDMDGLFTSTGHNFIGNLDDGIGSPDPDDFYGTTIAEIDPDLAPLDPNATIPVRIPMALSPLVDTGDSAFAVDGRGLPRPAASQDDRGAVELQPSDLQFALYIDIGAGPVPSDAYGAGAILPGIWNGYSFGGVLSPVDIYGSATGVSFSMSSESYNGFQLPSLIDSERLFRDHAFDCSNPEDWNLSFTGLPDGDYEVYVYAPFEDTLYTGSMTVNGEPLGALEGDLLEAVPGSSFASIVVPVSGGTLDVSGSDAFSSNCAGVSGVQVVPEPGLLPAVGTGLLLLAGARSRDAKSRRRPLSETGVLASVRACLGVPPRAI